MLVNPVLRSYPDPVLDMLSGSMKPRKISDGLFFSPHFNFNYEIEGSLLPENRGDSAKFAQDCKECTPQKIKFAKDEPDTAFNHMWVHGPREDENECTSVPSSAYGVCDSPEQLMELYGEYLRSSPRRFCVSFTEVIKAQQSPSGGWRWHKWGPYVGKQEPQYEYLYDEKDIDKVCAYHIYELRE